jgi:hypothetical protein
MITVSLTDDEAIVLFEFLSRFKEKDVPAIEHDAERQVLWNVLCLVEKNLTAPFSPDSVRILTVARSRVAADQS